MRRATARSLTVSLVTVLVLGGVAAAVGFVGTTAAADSTPPSYSSGYPTTSSVGTDGFDVDVKTDESGTAYYVVLEDGATAPSVSQVKNGKDGDGNSARKSGQGSISADTEQTFSVSGLSEYTSYDVYVVVEDDAGNTKKASRIDELTDLISASFPIKTDFDVDSPTGWTFYDQATSNTEVSSENAPSLRLTEAKNNQKGTALYGRSFPTSKGITAEFRYYTAGGDGADGFSFMLLDASKVDTDTFSTGAEGGSLGYSGDLSLGYGKGVPGGFLGIGFDEFGNFADSATCHDGGKSGEDSGVTVRGAGDEGPDSSCSDTTNNYPFLEHADPSQSIDGGWRRVRITTDPTAGGSSDLGVRVEMSFDGGDSWETVIDSTYSESEIGSTLPSRFYLGFSASTGGKNNVHAIDEVPVAKPVDLTTGVTSSPSGGPFTVGDTVEYTFDVSNNGPNDDSSVTLSPTVTTGASGLENIDWDTDTDDTFEVTDSTSTTVSLTDGETKTVTMRGTVGSTASGNLDHEITASGSSEFADPSPSDKSASVSVPIDDPPDVATSSGSNGFTEGGGAVTVDDSITVSDPESDSFSEARVVLQNAKAGDSLDCTKNHGITCSYDSSKGVLTLSDSGNTPGEFQDVMRSVTFSNSKDDPDTSDRTVTFSMGSRLPSDGTGHYYEYIDKTGSGGITWSNANSSANSKSYFGLQGYLVTVTSQAENDFVEQKLADDGWMGASDDLSFSYSSENASGYDRWYWVTGPEKGTHFWTGDKQDLSTLESISCSGEPCGDLVDSEYANWADNEPNDYDGVDGNENYAHFYSDNGEWNDFPKDNTVDGFVVEYGGLSNRETSWSDKRTVTVTGVNDQPKLSVSASNPTFTEDGSAVDLFSSASTDVIESGQQVSSLTVDVSTVADGSAEKLVVDGSTVALTDGNSVTTVNNGLSASVGVSSGTATVTVSGGFSESTANTIIDNLAYENTDDDPDTSDRTVTITEIVDDGGTSNGGSDTGTVSESSTVSITAVNDAPSVSLGSDQTVSDTSQQTVSSFATFSPGGDGDESSQSVSDYTVTNSDNSLFASQPDITNTGDLTYTAGSGVTGTATVTVRVTDDGGTSNGGSDTSAAKTFDITVDTVTGGPTADTTDPVADAGPDRTVAVGEAVAFDGTGSTDNENVEYYAWTFESKPDWTGATRTVSYDDPGEYTAELTVTDGAGNTDTDTVTVTVEEAAPEVPLTASLSADSQVISVGTTVRFDATESTGGDSYELAFGDDNTSESSKVVTHNFTTPGTHTVTLTVTDGSGETATDTMNISVADETPPTAVLAGPTTIPENTQVSFDASNSTDNIGITGYNWTLGDGTTATGSSVTHTYTEPGTYPVTVRVSDGAGQTTTQRQEVAVTGPNATTNGSTHDFQRLGLDSTATTALSITNTGTVGLALGEASITGDTDQFTLVGNASDLPTVQPDRTEQIQVRYTPTTAGNHTGTLTIPTNDSDRASVAWSLSGTGVETGLDLNTSAVSFGPRPLGESTTATVSVTNRQATTVSVTATLGAGTPKGYAITSEDTFSLQSGESRPVTVSFTPGRAGNTSGTLQLSPAGETTPVSVSLSGTGQGPRASLPDTVEFGAVGNGFTTNRTVAVTNTGTRPLDLTELSIRGADAGGFRLEPTATPTLAPGQRQPVTVEFAPTRVADYNASLAVSTNDSQATHEATLNGTAVGGRIGISARNLNYGNVTLGSTLTLNLTIRNYENSPAELTVEGTDIVGKDPGAFSVVEGGAGNGSESYTLAPGESQRVEVGIAPTTPGRKKAQLRVFSDARNQPQIDIWLSNAETVIIVKEVETQPADRPTAAATSIDTETVNVDATNVDSNTELSLNVSQPSTRREEVGVDALNMTTRRGGDFEMNLTHADDAATVGAVPYEPASGREVLQHIELTHTISNRNLSETGLVYRVRKSSLDDGVTPENVTFRRYDDGDWNTHRASLQRETASHYIYSVDTPGFSQFLVSAPQTQNTSETNESTTNRPQSDTSDPTTDTDDPSTTDEDPTRNQSTVQTTATATPVTTETSDTAGGPPLSLLLVLVVGIESLFLIVLSWRDDADDDSVEETTRG